MLALLIFISAVSAEVFTVSAPAGIVSNIVPVNAASPEAAVGFANPQPLTLEFTVDDATTDSNGAGGAGTFNDATGSIQIIGPGGAVSYQGGLTLTVTPTQISIESTMSMATAGVTPLVSTSITYQGTFTNPDDLAVVLAELPAGTFNGAGSAAITTFWDGSAAAPGMFFGPGPSPSPFPVSAVVFASECRN
jgi:hypothetical protein